MLFVQGIEMPGDVLEVARALTPAGFDWRMVPPHTPAGAIAEATREADYVLGFLFHLPDEACLNAHKLKLIQMLSAGRRYGLSPSCAAGLPK